MRRSFGKLKKSSSKKSDEVEKNVVVVDVRPKTDLNELKKVESSNSFKLKNLFRTKKSTKNNVRSSSSNLAADSNFVIENPVSNADGDNSFEVNPNYLDNELSRSQLKKAGRSISYSDLKSDKNSQKIIEYVNSEKFVIVDSCNYNCKGYNENISNVESDLKEPAFVRQRKAQMSMRKAFGIHDDYESVDKSLKCFNECTDQEDKTNDDDVIVNQEEDEINLKNKKREYMKSASLPMNVDQKLSYSEFQDEESTLVDNNIFRNKKIIHGDTAKYVVLFDFIIPPDSRYSDNSSIVNNLTSMQACADGVSNENSTLKFEDYSEEIRKQTRRLSFSKSSNLISTRKSSGFYSNVDSKQYVMSDINRGENNIALHNVILLNKFGCVTNCSADNYNGQHFMNIDASCQNANFNQVSRDSGCNFSHSNLVDNFVARGSFAVHDINNQVHERHFDKYTSNKQKHESGYNEQVTNHPAVKTNTAKDFQVSDTLVDTNDNVLSYHPQDIAAKSYYKNNLCHNNYSSNFYIELYNSNSQIDANVSNNGDNPVASKSQESLQYNDTEASSSQQNLNVAEFCQNLCQQKNVMPKKLISLDKLSKCGMKYISVNNVSDMDRACYNKKCELDESYTNEMQRYDFPKQLTHRNLSKSTSCQLNIEPRTINEPQFSIRNNDPSLIKLQKSWDEKSSSVSQSMFSKDCNVRSYVEPHPGKNINIPQHSYSSSDQITSNINYKQSGHKQNITSGSDSMNINTSYNVKINENSHIGKNIQAKILALQCSSSGNKLLSNDNKSISPLNSSVKMQTSLLSTNFSQSEQWFEHSPVTTEHKNAIHQAKSLSSNVSETSLSSIPPSSSSPSSISLASYNRSPSAFSSASIFTKKYRPINFSVPSFNSPFNSGSKTPTTNSDLLENDNSAGDQTAPACLVTPDLVNDSNKIKFTNIVTHKAFVINKSADSLSTQNDFQNFNEKNQNISKLSFSESPESHITNTPPNKLNTSMLDSSLLITPPPLPTCSPPQLTPKPKATPETTSTPRTSQLRLSQCGKELKSDYNNLTYTSLKHDGEKFVSNEIYSPVVTNFATKFAPTTTLYNTEVEMNNPLQRSHSENKFVRRKLFTEEEDCNILITYAADKLKDCDEHLSGVLKMRYQPVVRYLQNGDVFLPAEYRSGGDEDGVFNNNKKIDNNFNFANSNIEFCKMQLEDRLVKKLEVLTFEKINYESKLKNNEELGSQIFTNLSQFLEGKLVDKFASLDKELDNVMKLLFKLCGMIMKIQNNITGLPHNSTDKEKATHHTKLEGLKMKLKEALVIKENVKQRLEHLLSLSRSSLTEQQLNDLVLYYTNKNNYLIHCNELKENVLLSQAQLQSLRNTMNRNSVHSNC
ncbi:hypothetical protein HELRODRAFT_161358 [Helobdella robusta]|uniref:ASD2 domain-containing protein n=1 Tax=Helobdella robusta TaxID=6412 RepID=T1ERE0_HELRO|nr:hypothetical protein HELRODRAFT_161358 [Helobdella robusta]ESO02121.1 hypothetical protein HELRODRAFT_161358 [Helobdella robusta]